ncbi:MAG: aspartate--tRNA ligase [Kofleriaceae bacterium]|nr:aspartate--tRNA ligase [Kofleriaceae bacterium]
MTSFLNDHPMTHSCGALRESDVDATVTLSGWVANRRDHGGCVFIDLRDRDGITQVVFDPSICKSAFDQVGELRSEFCIAIVGTVASRGAQKNPKMATGAIEVHTSHLEIFSTSETPPFLIEDGIETNEALRLKYRYLDLRRPEMQKKLRIRSKASQAIRTFLSDNSFDEVETPFMVKYTPGGARNFVVPSRLNPGSFYALAESPQIYKQLLMVAGFERYFQITRCFRDEDLRQDRQPEFTQIDIEMSFISEVQLQTMIEGMLAKTWKDTLDVEIPTPFLRMTHHEAMLKYGCDKPDLRLDLTLCEVTEPAKDCGFKIFEGTVKKGGIVKCFRVPDGKRLSRSALDALTPFAKPYGIAGVAFARVQDDLSWKAPFAKVFTDEARAEVNRIAGAQAGDLLLFVADKAKKANTCMAAIRTHIGDKLGLINHDEFRFMWLTDPPLFEYSEGDEKWVSSHHPFTCPRPEDEDKLLSDPANVLARAYDVVLNGVELGGGSIRIHRADLQGKVFEALGISAEDAEQKFGFLLEAFRYGPPPHGGIALGLDRLAMLMTGAQSLRDVLAFPKTQKGTDLMSEAPTPVDKDQLAELYIQNTALPTKGSDSSENES